MRRLLAMAALAALALAVLGGQRAGAQQIMLDKGARVEGLWCFPSAIDPSNWYYVPNRARLVLDENEKPNFSFLRYVINRPSAAGDSKGITQAEGGGILHFLVTYDTPPELVRKAETALKRKNPDDQELSLRGPVIFKEGRYALVSATINPAGQEEPQLLATGNAPVLEGSQIALSFELPPERATLLMESLKMATPDISLVFEMVLEGLVDGFAAELLIHWDDVLNHESFGAKADVSLYYVGVSADAEKIVANLHQNKAVELKTRGADPNMEALLDRMMNQLLEMLFERVPKEEIEGGYQDDTQGDLGIAGLGSAASGMGSGASGGGEGSGPKTGFGVSFAYRTKQMRRSGTTRVDLSHQTPVEKVMTIGFNVGDLWTRYEDDPTMFKTVNLADPAFQQREIHVAIDGAILPEFEKYINSVTAVLRKQHQNGKTTVQEVVIDRETFKREQNDFRMIYGWNGDDDRTAWLAYDYRARWSFKGGGVYETDWTRSEANMIDLYAPYKRKEVKVFGDNEALAEQGVRVVVVEVDYPFFEGRKKDKIRMRADEPIADQVMELTLPLDQNEYHYRITWIRSGERLEAEGSDSTGILFVDELPAQDATPAQEQARSDLFDAATGESQ